MINPLKGKDFMFYAEEDGVMKPIACATSGTLHFQQEIKEATKPPSSSWRSYYSGLKGYDISVDGVNILDGDKVSGLELYQLMNSGVSVRWIAADVNNPSYHFSGYIIPTSLSLTSPADGHHTFSFSATGDGAPGTNAPVGFYGIEYGIEYQ